MQKIKYLFLAVSYVVFVLVSMLVFNSAWKEKITIVISNPTEQEYTFLYKKNKKEKKKILKLNNDKISTKISFSTNEIKVKELDNSQIRSIKLGKKEITSFEDFAKAKKDIQKELQVGFFVFSTIGYLALLVLLYVFYKLLWKKKDKIYDFINNEKNIICLNKTIFYITAIISVFFIIKYFNHPLMDMHSFRQTQTAISALYLIDNLSIENIINYQTPVLGYPWTIPFEFPFYQAICALIAKIFHFPLDSIGRCVSWVFYVLTLYPIKKLLEKITKSPNIFYITGALFLSSPLYVFWGRTFMMESFALFCGFMFAYNCIQYFDYKKPVNYVGTIIFLLLCGLEKITTLFGFVLVTFIYFCYKLYKKELSPKTIVTTFIGGVFSLIIMLLWIKHTDTLKSLNVLGEYLTSDNLKVWNYGTLEQRFSLDFWHEVFFRMNNDILGSYLIMIIGFVSAFFIEKKYQKYAFLFFFIFIAVLMTFTNLHYVHNYYQYANAIFLLLAFAFVLYGLMKKNMVLYITMLIITGVSMSLGCHKINRKTEKIKNNEIISLGTFIDKTIEKDNIIIVLGVEFSSEINYYAKRKGIAIPQYTRQEHVALIQDNSPQLTGQAQVGALVVAPIELSDFYKKFEKRYVEKYKPQKIKNIGKYKVYYDFL